ncbi:hypothetical protein EMCRGX_G009632 [Ephydatia muelleri]
MRAPKSLQHPIGILKGVKLLISYDAKRLLVSFVDVPISYVAPLLTPSKDHAATWKLMFQAKLNTPLAVVSNKRHGQEWIIFKVNFHIDNFTIVDKVIDALAPQSDVDHTLHDELHGLHADVYTFLRYGYAVHTREGIKASRRTKTMLMHVAVTKLDVDPTRLPGYS